MANTVKPVFRQAPPPVAVGDMLNAPCVTFLTPYTFRDVTIDPGVSTSIADGDIERIALAFLSTGPFGINIQIAPWGDAGTYSFTQLGVNGYVFFRLRDFYSLVTAQWFAFAGGGATIRVVEFKQPTFGGTDVQARPSDSRPTDLEANDG